MVEVSLTVPRGSLLTEFCLKSEAHLSLGHLHFVALFTVSQSQVSPDILGLRHESKVTGHFWEVQKLLTSCFSSSNQLLSTALVFGVTATNWIEA